MFRYGDIGDVYIPQNLSKKEAAQDFAIVRFLNKDDSQKVLADISELPENQLSIDNQSLNVSEVKKQVSIFSNQTGALGITNDASSDDGSRFQRTSKPFKQSVELKECYSRSGYPWGSKSELRILEPHAAKECLDMHGIKIANLNPTTT